MKREKKKKKKKKKKKNKKNKKNKRKQRFTDDRCKKKCKRSRTEETRGDSQVREIYIYILGNVRNV